MWTFFNENYEHEQVVSHPHFGQLEIWAKLHISNTRQKDTPTHRHEGFSLLPPAKSPSRSSAHFGGSRRLEQKSTTPAPTKKREHLSPHVTVTRTKEGDPCSVLLPSPSPHFGGSWRLEQKSTTPAPAKKREHLSPHVTKTKRRGSWLWPPAFFFTSFWQKLEIGTKVHISDSCQKERAFNSTLVLSGGGSWYH